jgi:hypothetical protein
VSIPGSRGSRGWGAGLAGTLEPPAASCRGSSAARPLATARRWSSVRPRLTTAGGPSAGLGGGAGPPIAAGNKLRNVSIPGSRGSRGWGATLAGTSEPPAASYRGASAARPLATARRWSSIRPRLTTAGGPSTGLGGGAGPPIAAGNKLRNVSVPGPRTSRFAGVDSVFAACSALSFEESLLATFRPLKTSEGPSGGCGEAPSLAAGTRPGTEPREAAYRRASSARLIATVRRGVSLFRSRTTFGGP